jgi:hypothetical protein
VVYRPVVRQRLETDNEATAVAMQRRGKHVSTTRDLLLETVLFTRSVQSGYKKDNLGRPNISRVEAGLNTSTVTLRLVGGDEKGSLESETVKYGRESHGTWPPE